MAGLYLSMFIFALISSITPGPVNIICISSGLSHGLRKTLWFIFGATFSFVLCLFISGLLFKQLIELLPRILQPLQWFSVVYLIWISYQLFKSASNINPDKSTTPPSFYQGCLIQTLNPKAWIAILSSLSLFVGTNLQLLIQFSVIYFVVCYLSLFFWAYAGNWLKQRMKSAQFITNVNRSLAGLLFLCAIYLAFSEVEMI